MVQAILNLLCTRADYSVLVWDIFYQMLESKLIEKKIDTHFFSYR